MLTRQGIVPQLVEQYNDLIEQNLIQNDFTDNQNNNNVLSDQTIGNNIKTTEQVSNDLVSNHQNGLNHQNQSHKSIQSQEIIHGNEGVLVNVSKKVDEVLNQEIIKSYSEEKLIRNEKVCKLDTKIYARNEAEEEVKPVIIKLNEILENLILRRKHCFVTKTIVPKEICGICSEPIKFSEKYIQCINCISISHLNCTPLLTLPCIPYTIPNLKPTKMLSNYAYPALKPSIPAILIHCCREIEERSHESSLNGLYIMKSEGLIQVKELCDKILKSKNGFPLLKDFNIDLICGVVKKFLSDFNESLIGKDMWKQFSYNMRKKSEEEIMSLTKQLIMELNHTNRDTLSFLVIHLQHLANNRKSESLEKFIEIFCPIICGDTEVTRKIKLMSSILNLNYEFWVNILLK